MWGSSSNPFAPKPFAGTSSSSVFGDRSFRGFGSTTPSPGQQTQSSAFGTNNHPFGFGPVSTTSAFTSAATMGFGSFATSSSTAPLSVSSSSSPFSKIGASTTSTFGGQTICFGPQNQQQRKGSRATPYTTTDFVEAGSGNNSSSAPQLFKLQSVSAMPAYTDIKSHEELRLEDYHMGDKGGRTTPTFGIPSSNPFLPSTTSPFAPKTSTTQQIPTNFHPLVSPSPFQTPQPAQTSKPTLTPSIFTAPSTSSTFTSSASTTPTSGTTSPFTFDLKAISTQSVGLFQPTTPSKSSISVSPSYPNLLRTTQPTQTSPTPMLLPSNNHPTSLQTTQSPQISSPLTTNNPFNPFQIPQPAQTSSTPSPPTTNFQPIISPHPFQPAQTSLTPSVLPTTNQPNSFTNTSQTTQPATVEQLPNPVVLQPTSPFGTLPAMPQISVGRTVSSATPQYGISSMPVTNKPVLARASSLLLTSRRLSQMRIGSTVRKYHVKNDTPKVAFYCDSESSWTPKADALLILPRENPRILVIGQTENLSSKARLEKSSMLNSTDASVHHHSGLVDNGSENEHIRCTQRSETSNGGHENKGDNIEVVMPKLKHADYYTEPRIPELAAKERAEPGFCQHVKNFVVGRQGYGSIKFAGETDVRGLDLESIVQFNHREVIVYLDDEEKPPVGQGLNKPAEVTLLSIKCYDKKTGQQYTEGPKIEKYKEMLMKKAQEQGAEFLSYEPMEGEWRFRVKHFN